MANRNYRARTSAQRHASPYRRARTKRRTTTRLRRLEAAMPQLDVRGRLAELHLPAFSMPTLDQALTSGWHPSKLLSGLILIAAAALIGWTQSDPRWFVYPDSVTFEGATYLEHRDLFPMTGANNWSIFWLREKDIRENLLAHPYVADAQVQIALPNRIQATVAEPEPVAVWMTEEGPMWVLADGAVLEIRIPSGSTLERQLLDQAGRELPTLVDMQRAAVAVNRLDLAVDRDVLDSSLALLARLPDVTQLRYNPGIGLNFALPGTPYWVYWGDGAELDDKLARLDLSRQMLEEGELRGQVIDVRFADRLVVR